MRDIDQKSRRLFGLLVCEWGLVCPFDVERHWMSAVLVLQITFQMKEKKLIQNRTSTFKQI
jgi:hypothetical protein